jgi:hypothetical protein
MCNRLRGGMLTVRHTAPWCGYCGVAPREGGSWGKRRLVAGLVWSGLVPESGSEAGQRLQAQIPGSAVVLGGSLGSNGRTVSR